jgi:UDP-3-O-[3-hydroxymyristoyl] glucosamine N-acyltransferase
MAVIKHKNPDGSKVAVIVGIGVELGDGVRLGNGVKLGDDVTLGDGVKLGDDVTLGDDVRIGSYARLGDRVRIGHGVKLGDGVRIDDRVRIGDGVRIDDRVRIGDGVVSAGEDGRGYHFRAIRTISGQWFVSAGCRWLSFPGAREHWIDNPEALRKVKYLSTEIASVYKVKL